MQKHRVILNSIGYFLFFFFFKYETVLILFNLVINDHDTSDIHINTHTHKYIQLDPSAFFGDAHYESWTNNLTHVFVYGQYKHTMIMSEYINECMVCVCVLMTRSLNRSIHTMIQFSTKFNVESLQRIQIVLYVVMLSKPCLHTDTQSQRSDTRQTHIIYLDRCP